MTDTNRLPDPPASEDVHDSLTPLAHFHFNILKVLRDAKQSFTEKTGKVAAYCYAPEPFLYMVDRAVRTHAAATGSVSPEVLATSSVTHVFGMELIGVPGTCLTITAEAAHSELPADVVELPGSDSVN